MPKNWVEQTGKVTIWKEYRLGLQADQNKCDSTQNEQETDIHFSPAHPKLFVR
jgi:hypothetical protein